MSLKLAMLLAGLSALVGVGFGYFLRWIISLGQRGSVELRIKQMELHAREEAKKITGEAQNKAEETLKETRIEFKEKEEKIKKTEDRLIKKEEFLDKRQLDIDKEIEQKYEEDIVVRMQKLENTGLEKIESKAKEILATSIQRLANSVSSEAFSTTVTIPSDEIKGKIIGKEGRNIKAFERVSGVEIIVDDTPGLITISKAFI